MASQEKIVKLLIVLRIVKHAANPFFVISAKMDMIYPIVNHLKSHKTYAVHQSKTVAKDAVKMPVYATNAIRAFMVHNAIFNTFVIPPTARQS